LRFLENWCKSHEIPLHHFDWSPEYNEAGFERDATYLLTWDWSINRERLARLPAISQRTG
jgi:hypothetical protein